MSQLDDSSRESYRSSLLAEVLAERFGGVPWSERHRKPLPLPRRIVRVYDKPRTTAARRRALNLAMADPIDARRERAA